MGRVINNNTPGKRRNAMMRTIAEILRRLGQHNGDITDEVRDMTAMIVFCLPSVRLGPVLVLVFGIYLDWLPVSGWGDSPGDKILPAITLGSTYTAYIARLSRAGMLEVMSQDYIRTARAKGLTEFQIITRHAVKNALNPVVTAISGWFASMLAGAVFVEYIFGWNGLGKEIVNALNTLDLPVIMGSVLVIALLFTVINIIVDLIYVWLDPKVKLE